jgi:hypothetical protein
MTLSLSGRAKPQNAKIAIELVGVGPPRISSFASLSSLSDASSIRQRLGLELSAPAAVICPDNRRSYDAALDVVAVYHIQRNDIGGHIWHPIAQ